MQKIKTTFKERLTGHKSSIYALEKINESTFVSGDGNGICILWNINETAKAIAIAQVPSNIFDLTFLKDKNQLFIGTFSSDFYVFDFNTKSIIASNNLNCSGIYDALHFNDEIIIAGGDGTIFFLNAKTFIIEKQVKISKKSIRNILKISETAILFGSSDGNIYKYNLESKNIATFKKQHSDSIFKLAKVNDCIISGSKDAHLKIWRTEQCFHSIPAHLFTINDVKPILKQKYFASASRDKSFKIWDSTTFELQKVIDPTKENSHINSVNQLLWFQKEQLLISASDDRSILIYKVLEKIV